MSTTKENTNRESIGDSGPRRTETSNGSQYGGRKVSVTPAHENHAADRTSAVKDTKKQHRKNKHEKQKQSKNKNNFRGNNSYLASRDGPLAKTSLNNNNNPQNKHNDLVVSATAESVEKLLGENDALKEIIALGADAGAPVNIPVPTLEEVAAAELHEKKMADPNYEGVGWESYDERKARLLVRHVEVPLWIQIGIEVPFYQPPSEIQQETNLVRKGSMAVAYDSAAHTDYGECDQPQLPHYELHEDKVRAGDEIGPLYLEAHKSMVAKDALISKTKPFRVAGQHSESQDAHRDLLLTVEDMLDGWPIAVRPGAPRVFSGHLRVEDAPNRTFLFQHVEDAKKRRIGNGDPNITRPPFVDFLLLLWGVIFPVIIFSMEILSSFYPIKLSLGALGYAIRLIFAGQLLWFPHLFGLVPAELMDFLLLVNAFFVRCSHLYALITLQNLPELLLASSITTTITIVVVGGIWLRAFAQGVRKRATCKVEPGMTKYIYGRPAIVENEHSSVDNRADKQTVIPIKHHDPMLCHVDVARQSKWTLTVYATWYEMFFGWAEFTVLEASLTHITKIQISGALCVQLLDGAASDPLLESVPLRHRLQAHTERICSINIDKNLLMCSPLYLDSINYCHSLLLSQRVDNIVVRPLLPLS